MLISLERLFAGDQTRLELDSEFDFSREKVNGVCPFQEPVKVKGTIENRAGIVSLEAEAKLVYHAFCDRCAKEAEREYTVSMEHILVPSLSDEADADEYLVLEDQQLDLEQLALEDIYLFLPSKFLCVDDCKGICPQCGTNLNEDSCRCKKEVDPRLEALLSMLGE